MDGFPADQAAAKKAIAALIERDGLDKVTSSKIRAHLKDTFNVDFAEFKKDVDSLTKQVIESSQSKSNGKDDSDVSESDDDVDEPTPKKKEKIDDRSSAAAADSDSDSSDPGVVSNERARPVKKKAQKRKASSSSLVLDDPSVDLMTAVKSRQRAAAKQATNNMKRTAPRSTNRKKEKSDDPDPEPKFGKMTKLCLISDELQLVTQRKFMKRCDVVRCMWEYIRRHELFDPKDRRFALCDDVLFPIFKNKKFKAFSMMKMLAKHIMDPEMISEEVMEESEREKEKLIQEWRARQCLRDANEDKSKSPSAVEAPDDGEASRDAEQSNQGDDSMNGGSAGNQSDGEEDSDAQPAAKKANGGNESDSYESDSD